MLETGANGARLPGTSRMSPLLPLRDPTLPKTHVDRYFVSDPAT